MRRIVLTFGLIAGAIMSAMLAFTLLAGEKPDFESGMVTGYASMVLAFMMVYFGVRAYRDNVAGGSIGFWHALRVGALISLVASSCYVASWQVIYHRYMPDFAEQYGAYAVETARKEGRSDAEIAELQREMAEFSVSYRNPLVNIGFTFLEPLPVALLATFATAGLLSRRRRGAEGLAVTG